MLFSSYKSNWRTYSVNVHFLRAVQYLADLLSSAKSRQGQGLVEYAAIIGFVAACMVVAELYLQPVISDTLNNVANSFHP